MMWNPKGNTRPKCRWPDHRWLLVKYMVIVQLGEQVVELHQCTECLRIKIEYPVRERD